MSKVVTQCNIYGPSYNIDAVIFGQHESMLIDTGSVVSLLTEDFVMNHIGFDNLISVDNLNLTLSTASGEKLQYWCSPSTCDFSRV